MSNTSSKTYVNSPFGVVDHPWLTKADVKYKDEGVYKFTLIVGGPEADAFKAKVDAESEAALARFFESDDGKKIAPKDRKHWKAYKPYKLDTDDNDVPTGYVMFRFKQNATIRLKDGTTKHIKIGLFDAANAELHDGVSIFGGSELRARFAFRDVVMKTVKEVGTQLSFSRVQVRKFATMEHTSGFDAVEGDEAPPESVGGGAAAMDGGDY